MKRKAVSEMMMTLLLVGMLTMAFKVQQVRASGTIYIRADGAVDPSAAPIQRDGDVYAFADNIYDSIVVERSNIVIDGNGYTLQGTGAYESRGMDLSEIENVTIRNTQIKNSFYGIYLCFSSNNSINENNIANNGEGIGLYFSSNSSISGNNITANSSEGIWLYESSNNSINGNHIANNGEGIGLHCSSNNRIYHNNAIDNSHQVYLFDVGANVWDDGFPSGGNYWSDYTGVDDNGDGIGDTPHIMDSNNTDRYPLMIPYVIRDTTPPTISILAPEYKAYSANNVLLTFTVNELTSWIGYSLDNKANMSVTGNTTLSELSDGSHSIVVYAKDNAGNTGASGIIYFTVETQQPFPTLIVAAILIIVAVGTVVFLYFTKFKKQQHHSYDSQ